MLEQSCFPAEARARARPKSPPRTSLDNLLSQRNYSYSASAVAILEPEPDICSRHGIGGQTSAKSMRSCLLSAIAALPLVCAVFQDEVGHIDFHHELLGVPQSATTFFHRPRLDDKASLLYSLSDLGVLGAVNPQQRCDRVATVPRRE